MQFINEFWADFSDTRLVDIEKIPLGFKNQSYLCTEETGHKFVIKIYASNFLSNEIIDSYCELVEVLRNKGIPVLELVRGKNGRYLQLLTGKELKIPLQITVSKYVEASIAREEYLNKEMVEEIADNLSKFHGVLKNIEVPGSHRELNPIQTIDELLGEKALALIKEFFIKNVSRVDRLDKYLEKYKKTGQILKNYFSSNSPSLSIKQLIHGDFNLSNLDIRDGKIMTIFDFDEMTVAPITFEIGCSIVHLDEGFMFSDDLFETYLRKYVSSFQLTDEEIIDVYMFMKYRCFYRISRYFTYYRFSSNKVEHFSKYQYKLDRYEEMDIDKLISDIRM